MKRKIAAVALALVVGGVITFLACSSSPPPAAAFKITSREQLIGGKRALGEVGDYKISNGVIHAIVQDVGKSRGFGAFGGSLIDLDLVRGGKTSSAAGTKGNDFFTEMFPAFFLQAIEPSTVTVLHDGSDGAAAVLRVSGGGGDFLSLAKGVNTTLMPQLPLTYDVDYILEPGKQYLKIVTTINNPTDQPANFNLSIPFGFITLLGEGQHLFVPGKAGFDMRFRIDEIYADYSKLGGNVEAFPGEVAPMVTAEGKGVSYAVAASPKNAFYMRRQPTYFPTAKPDSLLIPLASGSFLATFWGAPPKDDNNSLTIPPKGSYSYSGYVAVGNGDVASVQRVIYGIDDGKGERQPVQTSEISGRVLENPTLQPLMDVVVVVQDDQGNYVTSAHTMADGRWTAPVVPGKYRAYALDGVRKTAVSDYVTVDGSSPAPIDLKLDRPAFLTVTVKDDKGRALPAKISVEGIYDHVGPEQPRDFGLYNLKIGDRYRPSDLDVDTDDPQTRRYLERVFYAVNGTGGRPITPGHYKVYASRGIEYDLATQEVDLAADSETQVNLVLHQVMPTPGYVSGDFHVHSENSVDSDMAVTDRVASYAVEGIDYLASTDHNYVTDLSPIVEGLNLQDWVKTSVGLELTTLEMGHFNAFPLMLESGPVTHGSFDWFYRKPGDLFAQLRAPVDAGGIAKPGGALVEVNHPRDSIMGYFSAFQMNAYNQYDTVTVQPTGSFHLDQSPGSPYEQKNFSLDFDVLEIFNGKHVEFLHNYRIPPNFTDPNLKPDLYCQNGQTVDCVPEVGQVLQQTQKFVDGSGNTISATEPVFPGNIDDWYTLLAWNLKDPSRVRRLTAVGNSDSHGPTMEAGTPRTYLFVGDQADGSMRSLDEASVMTALRNHQATITNGPFVELWVNGQPIGSEVVVLDGKVSVRVKVQAAPWVDVSHVQIRRGGVDQGKEPETLKDIAIAPSQELVRLDQTFDFTNVPPKSFIVVEAEGDKSLWPVYMPYEIPPILLDQAVGAIGTTFGFGSKFGSYRPQQVRQATPYAITNPVFIVAAKTQALTSPRKVLPIGQTRGFTPKTLPDLRVIFGSLHSDAPM